MMMDTSKHIELAVAYERMGDPAYSWRDVFFQHMSAADRQAFDRWLVESDDPLAYEPGTTEHRFRAVVQRVVTTL